MSYSIVIADDDRTICKGLSLMIEKYCPQLKIADIFFNGDDLYNYLQKHKVSIVLSDIVMQGKNGTEVAEYVKKYFPETFVILITGHRVFDFAKSAINAKVDYFLTKPYTTDELITKLEEICIQIDKRSTEARNYTDVYMRNWQYSRDMVCQFYRGTVTPDETADIKLCAETVALQNLKCALITVSLNPFENTNVDCEQADFAIAEYGAFDSFYLSAIPLKKNFPNYTIAAFYTDEMFLLGYINDMKNSLFAVLNMNAPHEINFIDSYTFIYDFEHINQLSSNFTSLVLQNKSVISESEIDNTFGTLNEVQLRNAVYNIANRLNALQPDNSVELPQSCSADELMTFLKKLAEQFGVSAGRTSFIKEFQEYMQENYTKDSLTLKQVADSLQISSDYLGRLLKNNLGVTFTGFLSNKRIERAKYLLKNTTLPINRISHEIGYPNEKYFRRVFFNIVGCSPRDYRKSR